MNKLTVALAGDFHIPSALGLCPPTLRHDDGWTSAYSKTQAWIGRSFRQFVEDVKGAARGGQLYVVLVGDLGETDAKDRSWQLVTRNPATILAAIAEALKPLIQPANRLFVVRGTAAHGGKSNWIEEAVAANWSNAVPDERGNKSWWSLCADFGGVLFDVAHHTSGDAREWTANGAMVRLAKTTILNYSERKLPIPQLVFRGHMHHYRDSANASLICRAVTLPGWTALSEHEFRMGSNGLLAEVGGAIVTIEGGRYRMDVKTYPPERPQIWRA